MFIRKGITSNPEYNTVSPEPSCTQIFGNYGNFEEFLENCKDDNQYTIRVKNFGNYIRVMVIDQLNLKGRVMFKKKIDNCFRYEIELLEQLKK